MHVVVSFLYHYCLFKWLIKEIIKVARMCHLHAFVPVHYCAMAHISLIDYHFITITNIKKKIVICRVRTIIIGFYDVMVFGTNQKINLLFYLVSVLILVSIVMCIGVITSEDENVVLNVLMLLFKTLIEAVEQKKS